jgi:hypothetical protein
MLIKEEKKRDIWARYPAFHSTTGKMAQVSSVLDSGFFCEISLEQKTLWIKN